MEFLKEAKNAAENMANKMLKRNKNKPEDDLEEGSDEIMRTPARDNLAELEDKMEVDDEIVVGGKRRKRRRRKRSSKKGGAKRKSKKRTKKRKSAKRKRKTNKRKSKKNRRRR